MATTITDTEMISDQTRHTARTTESGWAVTWLPGRTLTQNQAVTAMTIAESINAALDPDTHKRMWSHVAGWAAELGLSAADAIARAL